jgi:ABC-type glycerol-3-phosphate transport system substrate-binding protein
VRKTWILLALLLLCATLMLPAAPKTTLRLWSWNNEGDYPAVFEQIIARFETANQIRSGHQWSPHRVQRS